MRIIEKNPSYKLEDYNRIEICKNCNSTLEVNDHLLEISELRKNIISNKFICDYKYILCIVCGHWNPLENILDKHKQQINIEMPEGFKMKILKENPNYKLKNYNFQQTCSYCNSDLEVNGEDISVYEKENCYAYFFVCPVCKHNNDIFKLPELYADQVKKPSRNYGSWIK